MEISNEKEVTLKRASKYLKLIANEKRLLIVCLINEKKYNVTELSEITGLSQPALSMHLKKLRRNGLVNVTRKGKEVYYFIDNTDFEKLFIGICQVFNVEENH